MKKIFKKKGSPLYAEIRLTDCNKDFYGGHRVMLTDGWSSDWPVQYASGKIAYDTFNPPKYAQELVKRAFAELNKYYPENAPRKNPKRKNPKPKKNASMPIVSKTSQGYEVSDIINGYRVHEHYIGYTKKEAVAAFKNKHYPRKNPKLRGFKVRVLYHTFGGAKPYYLHTEEGGVILVKAKGDKYKPTIYRNKLDAISGINSLMRAGRDIVELKILKA